MEQQKTGDEMRRVWMEHVWWTRNVIIGIISDLPGTPEYTARLLQNPADMMAVFAPYYTAPRDRAILAQLQSLFTDHLKTGGDIVTAAKAGNTALVTQLQTQWHQNSDQIAHAFAQLNPAYDETTVRNMMYTHLQLTTNEATQNLSHQYADEVKTFDQIQAEALMMADYFTAGLLAQATSHTVG